MALKTRTLAFAGGLLVFWTPPIAALIGGRAANAIVLLTPVALMATIVWSRALKVLLPPDGQALLSHGVKLSIWITLATMIGWAIIAAATLGLNLTTLFVICITSSICLVVAPFGLWWYNRVSKAIRSQGP